MVSRISDKKPEKESATAKDRELEQAQALGRPQVWRAK